MAARRPLPARHPSPHLPNPPTHPSSPLPTPPQGDATYLVVTNDNKLESYGINAVCTHLGCVVPWNSAENKVRAAEPGTGGRQGMERRLGGWDGAAWGRACAGACAARREWAG